MSLPRYPFCSCRVSGNHFVGTHSKFWLAEDSVIVTVVAAPGAATLEESEKPPRSRAEAMLSPGMP